MTSKFVSRLINDSASPSVYETIRQGDVDGGIASFGNDPCLDLDEENLGGHYHDEELAEALADAESVSCSRFQDGSLGHHPVNSVKGKEPERSHLCNVKSATGGNYDNAGTDSEDDNDDDDDVPPSLLVEGGKTFSMHELPPRPSEIHEHVIQINEQGRRPGSSHRTANPRWKDGSPSLSVPPVLGGGLATANPRDKAMWRWTNVENLDNFLMEVYTYFRDNGIQSICLRRFLNLLTLAFVVGFSTFLVNCIDYRAIPHSKLMPEIVVPKCAAMMSGWSNFLVWLFALLWIGKAFQYSLDMLDPKY
ncbi:Autophagy- protein 9A, partial [Ascosphaera aggregata]